MSQDLLDALHKEARARDAEWAEVVRSLDRQDRIVRVMLLVAAAAPILMAVAYKLLPALHRIRP